MEYLNYIILGLIVIFLVQRMLPAKGVRQITTAELKKELSDKGKQFIDVRTPGEYKANNIRGFKNIPLNKLASEADGMLSKDKEVIVICQSGMRSSNACRILKKKGFKQVTNVKGGMSAWF